MSEALYSYAENATIEINMNEYAQRLKLPYRNNKCTEHLTFREIRNLQLYLRNPTLNNYFALPEFLREFVLPTPPRNEFTYF